MLFLLDTFATPTIVLLGASWLGGLFAGWRLRAVPRDHRASAGPSTGSDASDPVRRSGAGDRRDAASGKGVGPGLPPLVSSLRDLLAAATQHTDELISVATPDWAMVWANPAYCRTLGYDLHEITARHAADTIAEQSRVSVTSIEEAVRTEGVWRGSVVRRRRDGSTLLSTGSVLGLRDANGGVSHFVSVERDVTQETHLREQLVHSERLAAVGQLVSGVAHELNNPLQSIIGFTELLIDAERRQEPRSDLEHVRAEAHRAAKIVRNLLAFVRRSAVERAPASLNALVEATVALRKYEFSISGVTLDESYGEDLPPVAVNREEIQQVLLNLILNAEQAMKPTGRPGHISLRTWSSAQGVTVEVADNGPGVPATIARRVFEPFYSTKGVGEGTGLGLSIALGIAEAHGGTLELVSRPEPGACFRLTLPSAGETATAPQATGDAAPTWTSIPGRRALVADDEPGLRKLLHRLLTRRGFAVDMAEDGLLASNMVELNRYDVILCDVQMPRMTGTQLFERLRRRQPHVASACALISGDTLDPSVQAFAETAQIPLLAKPFGAKNLDRVLDEVLARRMMSLNNPASHTIDIRETA
jgi:PAS domain S-box-containing protein